MNATRLDQFNATAKVRLLNAHLQNIKKIFIGFKLGLPFINTNSLTIIGETNEKD